MFETILSGIIGGVGYALTNYYAKSKEEAFDWSKFGTTTIIGVAAGVLFVVAGFDYGTGAEIFMSAGGVMIAQKLYAIIAKLFAKKTPAKKK